MQPAEHTADEAISRTSLRAARAADRDIGGVLAPALRAAPVRGGTGDGAGCINGMNNHYPVTALLGKRDTNETHTCKSVVHCAQIIVSVQTSILPPLPYPRPAVDPRAPRAALHRTLHIIWCDAHVVDAHCHAIFVLRGGHHTINQDADSKHVILC